MNFLLSFVFYISNLLAPATLTVEVSGIPNGDGNIRVGVYKDAENFGHPTKVYKSKIVKAKAGKVVFSIPFESGEKIAMALYHDENKNGELDKNLFGVPTEVYGFSNNARGTFSAPSFEEAALVVEGDKKVFVLLE